MLITLDGPSGSGKSTLAKKIAQELHIDYLDTGALYRSVAFALLEQKIEPKSAKEWKTTLEGLHISRKKQAGQVRYFWKERDITDFLRTPIVTLAASKYGSVEFIRIYVNRLIRTIAQKGDFVLDGRDMGSAVFPEADYKFFIIANLEIRARRRYLELKEKGSDIIEEQVLEDLQKRDEMDMQRDIDPLMRPKNSVLIDTSDYSIEEIVETILKTVRKKNRIRKDRQGENPLYKCWKNIITFYQRIFSDVEFLGLEPVVSLRGAALLILTQSSSSSAHSFVRMLWPKEFYLLKKSRFSISSFVRWIGRIFRCILYLDILPFKTIGTVIKQGKHVLVDSSELTEEELSSLAFMGEVDYLIPIHFSQERLQRPSSLTRSKMIVGLPIRSEDYRFVDKKEGRNQLMQRLKQSLTEVIRGEVGGV